MFMQKWHSFFETNVLQIFFLDMLMIIDISKNIDSQTLCSERTKLRFYFFCLCF
jgi:hypothetical protein